MAVIRMMHREDVVVGEGTTAEVHGAVLDKIAVSSGFAPGTHHRARHLNEVREHVEPLDSILYPAIFTDLVCLPLVKGTNAVGYPLHLNVSFGPASLNERALLVVDVAKGIDEEIAGKKT